MIGKDYILFISLVFSVLWIWDKIKPKNKSENEEIIVKKYKSNEYKKLLNQVLGDEQKAKRLIEYVKINNPKLPQNQCIEIASQIIENDIKRYD